MRIGLNPLKTSKSTIEPPAAISVAVLNFIPEQAGYFRSQLDSLKLCLSSIRANADQPFDLIVLDNGSCEEVKSYLLSELHKGKIDYLILNKRNVGKVNAVFQLLLSAPGDYIFFSDGDIYYKPGWMKAHLDIIKTYPRVGLVGGIPLRNHANVFAEITIRWVKEQAGHLNYETGDLIPESWTREFLQSVGAEKSIENWIHLEDCRVTYNGVTAYVSASHMQYLIARKVVEQIPRYRSDKALCPNDTEYIDSYLESKEYLRLSTERPFVYHIGNSISEAWLAEEYSRLVQDGAEIDLVPSTHRKNAFMKRQRVRRFIKAFYEWSFKLYYE